MSRLRIDTRHNLGRIQTMTRREKLEIALDKGVVTVVLCLFAGGVIAVPFAGFVPIIVISLGWVGAAFGTRWVIDYINNKNQKVNSGNPDRPGRASPSDSTGRGGVST